MGAWRYCQKCGAGQSRITLEEIRDARYTLSGKVECDVCSAPREDDEPDERSELIVEALLEMKEGRQS